MAPTAKPAEARPTGRDEVRSAILGAATRRFAAEGTRASLRDIAADADVNLGLIHRHFGNKADLLRAVIRHHVESGSADIAAAPDAVQAIQQIFEGSITDGLLVRVLAWLLLEGSGDIQFQDEFPGMAALRGLPAADPTADREARLMAAMATVYGWTVFGSQILTSFETDDRAGVEAKMADLLAELVAGPRRPSTGVERDT